MNEKYYCPMCGAVLISDGYNYEDAHIHRHCSECEWSGVETKALLRYVIYVDNKVVESYNDRDKALEEAKSYVVNTDYESVKVCDNCEGEIIYTTLTYEDEPSNVVANDLANMINQYVYDNHISIKDAIEGCNIAIEQLGDSC